MTAERARPGRPKVFVTRSPGALDEGGDLLAPLAERAACAVWQESRPPSREELLNGVQGCDGLLCLLTDRVDAALMAENTQLSVISSMSVGVDHIDVQAATERGIPVGHTPGVLAETTADLTFALLLGAARRIPEADRLVREGRWTSDQQWAPDMLLGRDLHGATLGVIGLGAIGRAVARRAQGFGMRVLGWTRSGRTVPGVEAAELDQLLATADFVTVHVALADETQDLLDAAAIRRLKRGAVLVNTARGGIVDEDALARALTNGSLAAAALDVFASEPLPQSSPLLTAPNLVLAPHIGSASIATRRKMAKLAIDNLIAGLEGRPMKHCVNTVELARSG